MKQIRFYLDEAAEKGIAKNDIDIARKLGIKKQTVSNWRNGNSAPNEDQAATLAELLGKPEILAECMAIRASKPETRAVWERAAAALSMAAKNGKNTLRTKGRMILTDLEKLISGLRPSGWSRALRRACPRF